MSQAITRDAYLTTTCHAWSGIAESRVDLWLEPDGTIWADDTTQGRNWGEPEWTTCHDIDVATQRAIWAAAEASAKGRGLNGGELGSLTVQHLIAAKIIMQPKPADMSGGVEPQVDPDTDLPDPSTPEGCCRCDRCEDGRAEFVPRHPAESEARNLRLARWYDTGISYESEDGGPEEDEVRSMAGVHSVNLSLHEAEQQWHLIALCAPETAREHGWDPA